MKSIVTFGLGLLFGACLFSLSIVSAGPCDKDVLDIYRGAPKMPDYVIPLPIPGSVPYRDYEPPRYRPGNEPN